MRKTNLRHQLNQNDLQQRQIVPEVIRSPKIKFISCFDQHSPKINSDEPISSSFKIMQSSYPLEMKNYKSIENAERLALNQIPEDKILQSRQKIQREGTQNKQKNIAMFQIKSQVSNNQNNLLTERQNITQFKKNYEINYQQSQQQQFQEVQNQFCNNQLQIIGNLSSNQGPSNQQQHNQNQKRTILQIKCMPIQEKNQEKRYNEIGNQKKQQFQEPQQNQPQISLQEPKLIHQKQIIKEKIRVIQKNGAPVKDQILPQFSKQVASYQHQGRIIKDNSVNGFQNKLQQNTIKDQLMNNQFNYHSLPNSLYLGEQNEIFQSVSQTILLTCKYCQMQASEQIINLPCKHFFHIICFVEFITNQFKNQKISSLQCYCKRKINQKIIQNNCKEQFEILLENQAEVIFQNLRFKKFKCQNCKFFCIIDQCRKIESSFDCLSFHKK